MAKKSKKGKKKGGNKKSKKAKKKDLKKKKIGQENAAAKKGKQGKKKSKKKDSKKKRNKKKADSKKKASKKPVAQKQSRSTAAATSPKKSRAGRQKTPVRNRPGLTSKIKELFAFREIPWLMSHADISSAGFEKKLIDLQARIYDLDHYLETNWDLRDDLMAAHWSGIHKVLTSLGLSSEDTHTLCRQIEKYQSHEESLRSAKSPTRFSMRHLYYYKSCDVRLIRSLIYREDPSLQRLVRLTDWTDFDLITEVNDDITDLAEDMKLFNGNRLLFELHEHGKAEALKTFRSFIREIELSTNDRFRDKQSSTNTHVKRSTKQVIKDTRALLRTVVSDSNPEGLSKALVIKQRTSSAG